MILFVEKIKKKIKSKIGYRQVISPLIDPNKYDDLSESFAGGSLSCSHVLWVVNDSCYTQCIDKVNKVELIKNSMQVKIQDFALLKGLKDSHIYKDTTSQYEQIINVFSMSDNHCHGMDIGHRIFGLCKLIQDEMQLLKDTPNIKIVSTLVFYDEGMETEKKTLSNYISGMARNVLIKKKIICNAVFASNLIPMMDAFHAITYMSSKYAYGMAGEVLYLKSR